MVIYTSGNQSLQTQIILMKATTRSIYELATWLNYYG